MGTDTAAIIVGFADRKEMLEAVNKSVFKLTGIAIDSSLPWTNPERLRARNTLSDLDRAIFSIKPSYDDGDDATPFIAVSCLRRWKPDDMSSYSKFVDELKSLGVGTDILLLNDYDLSDLIEGTKKTAEDLIDIEHFIHFKVRS